MGLPDIVASDSEPWWTRPLTVSRYLDVTLHAMDAIARIALLYGHDDDAEKIVRAMTAIREITKALHEAKIAAADRQHVVVGDVLARIAQLEAWARGVED